MTNCTGTSTWKESTKDFPAGIETDVQIEDEGITLKYNETLYNAWTRLADGEPEQFSPSIVYDSSNDECYMFSHGMWIYDITTATWRNDTLPDEPMNVTLYGQNFVYDSKNDAIIHFGGQRKSQNVNETWVLSLDNRTWTNMTPEKSPSVRYGAAMAYDETDGVTILFGGHAEPYRNLNDTWIFNLTSATWTEMNPQVSPPPRQDHVMAYDENANAIVVFGGNTASMGIRDDNETWAYWVSNNTWKKMEPAISPSSRLDHSMAYDTSARKMVLFGGSNHTAGAWRLNDTWTYDLSKDEWANVTPEQSPSKREGHAMAYSPVGDCTLMVGGGDGSSSYKEIWKFDVVDESWTLQKPTTSPPARWDHAMTFDSGTGNITLFGGHDSNYVYFNDTWVFNITARNWKKMVPGTAPSARWRHSMAYDPDDEVSVLFGGGDWSGYLNDTWTYNGRTDTWTKMKPAASPSTRWASSMVYDAFNQKILLFGGGVSTRMNDTWTYDVARDKWTEKLPANSPPTRDFPAMAYDAANSKAVLFGGFAYPPGAYSNPLNDTWVYNSSNNTWTRVYPKKSPPARGAHSMVYDSEREAILLYGGTTGTEMTNNFNDTWEYDLKANNWTKISTSVTPPPRRLFSMAYDDQNGIAFSFGGHSGKHLQSEGWGLGLKEYGQAGCFTSSPKDTGGEAFFGKISWTSATPLNTTIAFQIRSASTKEELADMDFIGPDGTNATNYTESGTRIHSSHNGTRWIQYKAYLRSGRTDVSPTLKDLTITYNLLHNLSILYPTSDDECIGNINVSWMTGDRDNDAILLDIYVAGESGETALAKALPGETGNWTWNTSNHPNGRYHLRMVAHDDSTDIPLSIEKVSDDFILNNSFPNNPPTISLMSPADQATVNSTAVTLTWAGNDTDGDELAYSVFLSDLQFNSSLLPSPIGRTGESQWTQSGLMDGKTYFWTVLANDGKLNGSVPAPRRFVINTTVIPPNQPPRATMVSPLNNTIINTSVIELNWRGYDYEQDPLVYFVFISLVQFDLEDRPSSAVSTNLTNHTVASLSNDTTYFWTVIPNDGLANGTTTGVWRFTVELPSSPVDNHNPIITSQPAATARIGIEYSYNVTAIDEDGDALQFFLVAPKSGMSLNSTTGRLSWVPISSQLGNHTIRIRVQDTKGGYDEQEFTITVYNQELPNVDTRPKCNIIHPKNASILKGKITVGGEAQAGTFPVTRVEIRIDAEDWHAVTGMLNWTFLLDTTKLKNGNHTIHARALDGVNFSDTVSIHVVVNNKKPEPTKGGFIPGFEIFVTGMASAYAFFTMRIRRGSQ